jgi:hypothetical protein
VLHFPFANYICATSDLDELIRPSRPVQGKANRRFILTSRYVYNPSRIGRQVFGSFNN